MSNAFDHPEHRALATAPQGVHDRLSLRDHIQSVEIGAFQAERDMVQRLSFDVVVEVAAPPADLDDDVDRILSYDEITWAIEHELAAERLNLLETLAERIADRILRSPLAMRAFVRIQKLDKGNGALGVEIVRVPGQGDTTADKGPEPIVAFFDNAALESDLFDNWIAQLQTLQVPILIALDVPKDLGRVASARAQLNIDLLASEQRAWRLAAANPSLTVAGSKTEIDWALRNQQIVLWAPAKLVLDATENLPESPVDLAQWVGKQFDGKRLICFGNSLPKANTMPLQTVTLDQTTL